MPVKNISNILRPKLKNSHRLHKEMLAVHHNYLCGRTHLEYCLGCGLDAQGIRVWFLPEQQILCSPTMLRLAEGLTQPTTHWVLEVISPKMNWLKCQAWHSPPFSTEVKNARSKKPFHVIIARYLLKHRTILHSQHNYLQICSPLGKNLQN